MRSIAPDFLAPTEAIESLPGPKGLPVIGNTLDLLRTPPPEQLRRWANEFGPTFRYRIGSTQTVCLSDYAAVQDILRHRPDQFRRQKLLADTIAGTGFRGLFTAEGEDWRTQRPVVMRGLSPTIVSRAFPMIDANTCSMLARWESISTTDGSQTINADLKSLSLKNVLWTALGLDTNALRNDGQDLSDAIDTWFATVGKRARQIPPIRRFMERYPSANVKEALKAVDDAVRTAISDGKHRMAGKDAQPSNMLEAMLQPGSDEAVMTQEQIVGNTATMIVAGQETTASAMSWLLVHLSENPDLIDQLRNELALASDEPQDILKSLNDSDLLRETCLQCLGARPVAPLVGLTALEPVRIGNLSIPAQCNVVLMLRAPDDRKASQDTRNETSAAEKFAFGAGPRLCPGRYLALVEMMSLAAGVIKRFDLTRINPQSAIQEKYSFTMYPETVPIELRLRVPH